MIARRVRSRVPYRNPEQARARNRRYYLAHRGEWQERNRLYYAMHRETRDAQARAWAMGSGRAWCREWQRAWRAAHPGAQNAHAAVARALRTGRLERGSCVVCGGVALAHHADYAKPLAVEWLCARHHGRRHTLAGKAGRTVKEATEPGA